MDSNTLRWISVICTLFTIITYGNPITLKDLFLQRSLLLHGLIWTQHTNECSEC